MADQEQRVTFRISAAAAPYVGAEKPRENRLKAAAGRVKLPPAELVLLVYYLCNDQDPEVKRTAQETLKRLDVPFVTGVLSDPELHPRILDLLVRLHCEKPELLPLFAAHPNLSEAAAVFLAGRVPRTAPDTVVGTPSASSDPLDPSAAEDDTAAKDDADAEADPDAEDDPDVEAEAEDEEFQSKYQLAQSMGISDKIKMALTGDKEWRSLLIKDSNKLVSGAVVKNPRMTEGEVLTIAKSSIQNDEIIRIICANKEWVKNAQIRRALAENVKTPLPAALRFLGTLSEKDLSMMAKSKNISSVISAQARRLLLNKQK